MTNNLNNMMDKSIAKKDVNMYNPHQPTKRMNIMTKPTGSTCNIDCQYCYYLSKEELLGDKDDCKPVMKDDMLEEYIRTYIEQQNHSEIVFHWQGGEPTLLGVNYFRDVVRLQKKYAPKNVTIENNMQTNGILLNDEWGKFLAKNNFMVGISIDGPEMIHNTYRVNRAGRGTFKQTFAGIKILHKYNISFATLTCVNNLTGDNALEIYRFLRDDVKSKQMQFIPIVEPKSFKTTAPQHWKNEEVIFQGMPEMDPSHRNSVVESWCVSPSQWGKFLCTVFDEWLDNDIGQINVPYFEASIEAWMGRVNPLCTLAPMCGKGLAIEANGDVFSCDHYVYPEYKLGNIKDKALEDMQFSAGQEQFGRAKEARLPKQCRECEYQFACFGECPKNRFIKTLDGESGLNYLCGGWKQFFSHIDQYIMMIIVSMGYNVHKKINADAMKIKFK
ncbi:anaerobic sulfatase maturase [Moritella sp. F3]|uniref:anaerobic sulfatase maturase n=1 Tax=Moritella sp. F3 TaxID=2718882 RepID=UPI0018E1C611|nr:anaerobic sulfatase maturase [Moritella sp. F3]GIC75324.1 anaerobic sulfatase maturase [Moritella sp. F1]GIC80469.1 anaerobic sulfatase maturase [Moritella sp. F3]